MNFIRRTHHFFSERIWDVELSSLSIAPRMGIKLIRILHLVYNGFLENECPLHASALTYSSLMAIVPTMALALALLRGLGAGEWAEQHILLSVGAMPDQFQHFVENIFTYVSNTNFATLGGIGLVLLLWMVVQVIGRVEMSFNRVWGVQKSRPILRKFSDYLSILMVVPVLMIAATTINTTLTSATIIGWIQQNAGAMHIWYLRAMKMTPLVTIWVAFTFLYKFMPNTRVRLPPAFISGIFGGSLWVIWQRVYIQIQVGVSNYNKIYGAFASVPIFLLWLYISWQIILLGAELGFALQNYATYKLELRAHGASMRSRIMLALSIISHAAQSMMVHVPYFEIAAYARQHRVSVRLINEVVKALSSAGLLGEIAGEDGRYVLLKPPAAIRVREIMDVMLQNGTSPQSLGLENLNPAIRHLLGRIDNGIAESLKDFNLPDLLQLHSRLEKTPDTP